MNTTVDVDQARCQPISRGPAARLVGLLALCILACSPGTRTASEALGSFYEAVQAQDFDRLYCLMAGAAQAEELGATHDERRAGFEDWAQQYYAAYNEGRDRGQVDLDEQGLALVKLFSLGRGTFVTYGRPRSLGEDGMVVESRVQFGYAQIDLSPFSPGTTFYVCGAPAGRVHPIRVPAGSAEVTVDVLDRITVEWTLLRKTPTEECPGEWSVSSGRPVEGSENSIEITWIF